MLKSRSMTANYMPVPRISVAGTMFQEMIARVVLLRLVSQLPTSDPAASSSRAVARRLPHRVPCQLVLIEPMHA